MKKSLLNMNNSTTNINNAQSGVCIYNRANALALAAAPAVGSIDSYIGWVNQVPMLTAEEELELALRLQRDGDIEAARKLILAHLRFVVYVAKKYLGYGLPKADLIQEGTIGLMKAVKRFDYRIGVRLVSFAVHWIKAEIHEFILRNWRIVKIATTKAQRKLFFNLRRATKKLNWLDNDEVATIAQELKVAPEEVRIMEARMNSTDVSFDGYRDEESESSDNYYDPEKYLTADTPNPLDEIADLEVNHIRAERLAQVLSQLDQRSREILEYRWLQEKKATLHELAAKYHVSAERIRQIEESAIKKIKKDLVLVKAV